MKNFENATKIAEESLFNILTDSNNELYIPEYQRQYSWNEAKWELILDSVFNENSSKFSGNIIFRIDDENTDLKNKINKIDIVDGQQRITTYIIMLVALYSNIKSLSKTDKIMSEIMSIYFNITSENFLNISNNIDKKSFENIIKFSSSENNASLNIPKKTLLEKCFKYFFNKFKENNINEIFEKIKHIYFSVFKVSSEDEAIEIFVSMNTRGEQLRKWDIIKSKFILNSIDKNKSIENWKTMSSILSDDLSKRDYFLLFYLNCTENKYVSNKELIGLYSNILNEEKERIELLNEYESNMIEYASILSNIFNPTQKYWGQLYEIVYDIYEFKFKQIYPFIAIVKKRMSENENNNKTYLTLLEDLFLYFLRTSTISDIYGTEPKTLYSQIKSRFFQNGVNLEYKSLESFKSTTIDSVKNGLLNRAFESSHEEKLAKFILRKYYIQRMKLSQSILLDVTYQDLTLEHIIDKKCTINFFTNSENSEEMIREWIRQDDIVNDKFKLGNFTLLRKEDNTTISSNKKNKKWIDKVQFYWKPDNSQCLFNLEDSTYGFKVKKDFISIDMVKKRGEHIIDYLFTNNFLKYSFE